jgi:hypothetical protein
MCNVVHGGLDIGHHIDKRCRGGRWRWQSQKHGAGNRISDDAQQSDIGGRCFEFRRGGRVEQRLKQQ